MGIDVHRTARIYRKLSKIAPDLAGTPEHARASVQGMMDLHLDVLERSDGYLRIALSHYWKHPSGDMIADPDMEIGVYLRDRLAEALTYQDSLFYEVAYPKDGEPPDFEAHTRLNEFLEQWLDNLAEQGFVLPRGH